jgi:hypothetical protein
MPSASAGRVIAAMVLFLERKLSPHEEVLCEEMSVNVFPMPIIQYIDRLKRKGCPKIFDSVYFPITNGVIKQGIRRFESIKITTHQESIYWRLHGILKDGFNDREMEHVLWLAEVDKYEFEDALRYARSKMIHSAAYLKTVIIARRTQAKKIKPTRPIDEVIPDEKPLEAVDIGKSRKNWKRKAEIAEVELHAKGSNTTNKAEVTTS